MVSGPGSVTSPDDTVSNYRPHTALTDSFALSVHLNYARIMEKRQRRLLVAYSVHAEMARQGWSSERLSASLRISLASLESILAGQTAPDIDTLDEIAAVLGVAVESLLGSDEQPP